MTSFRLRFSPRETPVRQEASQRIHCLKPGVLPQDIAGRHRWRGSHQSAPFTKTRKRQGKKWPLPEFNMHPAINLPVFPNLPHLGCVNPPRRSRERALQLPHLIESAHAL